MSEGLPLVVLEAMAAGVPVIATDVGGVPEVIRHGVNGILVPSGNAAALEGALATLASSSEMRLRMAAAGRERVEREFRIERVVDELRHL
jgi:glycosyltransferase involved in cell wall biosynthesis